MANQDSQQKGPVRKLGRGLSALLGNPVQIQSASLASSRTAPRTIQEVSGPAPVSTTESSGERPVESASPQATGLLEIPVEQIVPNRLQPRSDFDQDTLKGLAESIRTAGLMQPVMVRRAGSGYELIAGERRWRAAKIIGLTTIPAVVRDVDDQLAAELAIIENVQREDLNPIERAHALRRLADDFGLTHQSIAEKVGLDRASITNLLRLTELDQATADHVRRGSLSQGHAKALLGVSDLAVRSRMGKQVIEEGWSVRELERRVKQYTSIRESSKDSGSTGSQTVTSARDANVIDLEKQLAEYLGTRVTIHLGRKKGSGRLTVDFYNLDQFDGLMQRIGFGNR